MLDLLTEMREAWERLPKYTGPHIIVTRPPMYRELLRAVEPPLEVMAHAGSTMALRGFVTGLTGMPVVVCHTTKELWATLHGLVRQDARVAVLLAPDDRDARRMISKLNWERWCKPVFAAPFAEATE